jgi:hypothetical protein
MMIAITLCPSDTHLREEYSKLKEEKLAKEKEWWRKNSGFYNS